MLVKYKTILYGEKPTYNILERKDIFRPKKAAKYEIVSHDFCCDKIKDYIEHGNDWLFGGDFVKEPSYSVCIPDGYGDVDYEEVFFCPFCGKKIEYKEVERFKYKKIKSFDYNEIKE